MKTLDERIAEVEKTMLKEYNRGQNNEITNSKYRELLKEKQKDVIFLDAKHYENQFKPKDYNLKLK